MIIRVLTDNQYRLPGELAPQVDQMDDALMAAVRAGDEAAFANALRALIDFVRERGTLVPADELVASNGILPAPDMTLTETKELLAKAEIRMPTE